MGEVVRENCNNCTCQISVSRPGCMEVSCSSSPCLTDLNLLAQLSSSPLLPWSPTNYSQFWGRTLQDGLRARLGAQWPRSQVSWE